MFKSNVIGLASLLSLTASLVAATETYKTDAGHTEVFFGWSHAGVSMQHGEFTRVEGLLNIDPVAPENAFLDVAIDVSSIATGVPALDRELLNSSWLNAEAHPEITFKSTGITLTGENTADVVGDLTMNGRTNPVVLKAELLHQGKHPVGAFLSAYKGEWLAFHAETKIRHRAFGVGDYSTGDIFIEINAELQRQ
ncbi:YceI family protein [Cognatishimia activa]|uniref:YceI family protein n=1 Tax=Cognatishimia activa TaxID=1715691 RepID=UPI0022305123|nr:YceI family protein [Cognatishimia activa]UZD89955.1 YceI family protein [Cognatishimia activa]